MEEKNLVYRYDGSFRGILCCVYEIYTQKEFPAQILEEDDPATLYPEKWVKTDEAHARRVWRSLPKKLGKRGTQMVRDGYWTCLPDKALTLCRFIARGYQAGPQVVDMLADETVNQLNQALQYLYNETHLFQGFVRFSISGHVMTAAITPRNRVLPLLKDHFFQRYPEEYFLLYDKTHREALIHQPGKGKLIPMEQFIPNPPDEEEQAYRAMWKQFYDTIAIRERENPKCRMSHLPKRYWGDMTEFQEMPVRSYGEKKSPVLQGSTPQPLPKGR